MAATPANTPDREAAGELLGGLAGGKDKPEVVGDSAYGDASTRAHLEAGGFTLVAKCPPARNTGGRFAKDRFTVDLERGTVTCPAGQTAVIVPARDGGGRASFGPGARPARCGLPAPPPGAGAPSRSTRRRRCCSAPAAAA